MKWFLLFLFLVFNLLIFGQKEEPLVIYKCDTSQREVKIISTKYPPVLKMKRQELETLLNGGLNISSSSNENSFTVNIVAIINCDSTATYELPLRIKSNKDIPPELGNKIIEILKSNCQWSPGKTDVVLTKRILKKVNNKLVPFDQYTHYLTQYEQIMQFKIADGKISLLNYIKFNN